MEHLLKPAGDEGLRRALMPLMLSTIMPNMEGMSDETQQAFFAAKSAEYSRLMSHLPPDIIREACDQHVKRSKFFPAIAELMEVAEPAFALRQRQAKRLEYLLKTNGKPKPKVFEPEPEAVRLQAAVNRYFANKSSFVAHILRRTAIEAEKRLAEIEARPVAAWVGEAEILTTAPTPEPVAVKRTAALPDDEPPMPDEIPEGDGP